MHFDEAELIEICKNLDTAIKKSELAKQIAETNLFQAQCMKEDIEQLRRRLQ